MTGKFHLTRWGIISLALVVALATIGVSYAQWAGQGKGKGPGSNPVETDSCDTEFIWVVSNDDGDVRDVPPYEPIDPGDNGLDPSAPQAMGIECDRYDKNVASTTASVNATDSHYITVLITNAYPSYYPTIFYGLENKGTIPGTIETIEVDEDYTGGGDTSADNITALTVTVTGIYEKQEIAPGEKVIGDLEIHVEQEALQDHTYTIRVKITFVCVPQKCGTAYAYYDEEEDATCFTEYGFKSWGWTNGPLSAGEYTFDFYAGAGGCDISKGTVVGTVTVDYDGSTAIVTYDMDDGYTMDVTHLYVGNEPLPTKNNGDFTVAPGQYPYTHVLQDATTDSYEIEGLSGDIYVIAHAVVCW